MSTLNEVSRKLDPIEQQLYFQLEQSYCRLFISQAGQLVSYYMIAEFICCTQSTVVTTLIHLKDYGVKSLRL